MTDEGTMWFPTEEDPTLKRCDSVELCQQAPHVSARRLS